MKTVFTTRVSVESPVTWPACVLAGCCSKGVIEPKGVVDASDHPQVVASLVLKETVTLSVPGARRLLAGLMLVMLNAEEASASVGANSTGRLNRMERIKHRY